MFRKLINILKCFNGKHLCIYKLYAIIKIPKQLQHFFYPPIIQCHFIKISDIKAKISDTHIHTHFLDSHRRPIFQRKLCELCCVALLEDDGAIPKGVRSQRFVPFTKNAEHENHTKTNATAISSVVSVSSMLNTASTLIAHNLAPDNEHTHTHTETHQ